MEVSEDTYKLMCRDVERTLRNLMGDEKFQEWWAANVVALNNKVWLDMKTLYLVMREELDDVMRLYDQMFRQHEEEIAMATDHSDWLKETTEMRMG